MFEALTPIAAMILVSSSAIVGALVSLFTKLEMSLYRHQIEKWRVFAGSVLLLAVLIISFNMIFIPALAIGIAAGFLIFKKDRVNYNWIVLGALLGLALAFNSALGFAAAMLVSVYNFLYATVLNIPLVLKKKKFLKARLAEQIVFLAAAAASYLLMFWQQGNLSGFALYFAAGLLVVLLIKEIKHI
ncbi:MAG: hypothetical protein PHC66_04505 [Candidatus Nanoarchaeia archaeon]|nr:hypothetical protein [Candidatus Nanoarchaeia archaeon]MDD5239780.1 hypothetical protein [Candidatus Nanoarchaeia archaeon]